MWMFQEGHCSHVLDRCIEWKGGRDRGQDWEDEREKRETWRVVAQGWIEGGRKEGRGGGRSD